MKYSAKESHGTMTFQLSEVDKSFANAIRRTIIGNIPIPVFKAKDCVIHTNTTRFTNEIIKSRIACLPIHQTNFTQSFTLEYNKKNEEDHTIYLTTEGFKRADLFKPTVLQGFDGKESRYPDWLRLRTGEEISFTATSSAGTANECGAYNVAGTCSYGFTQDKHASEVAFREQERVPKADWDLLDGRRYVVPNSFEFVLESIVIENRVLLLVASDILQLQFNHCKDSMTIHTASTTMEDCYEVHISGDYTINGVTIELGGDYTIGKMLEYEIYQKFKEGTVSYVSFYKKHPHDTIGILKIASRGASEENIRTMVKDACEHCIATCKQFSSIV
jgi:DNA-directed RNA polymerase subunit L